MKGAFTSGAEVTNESSETPPSSHAMPTIDDENLDDATKAAIAEAQARVREFQTAQLRKHMDGDDSSDSDSN